MAKAIESQGVKIFVGTTDTSPSQFTAIGNVVSIKGPGGQANVIDVTNLDSLGKEKLMGIPDEGQITVEMNYDPDNVQHAQLRNARKNRTRLEFKIQLTDPVATILAFFAYVTGFSMDVSVDQQVKVTMQLEVDGAVSEA